MNRFTGLLFLFLTSSCTVNKNHSLDLKTKTWHTGVNRYGGGIVAEEHPNGFSNHIYIHFADDTAVSVTFYQYSPSIGPRTSFIKGTYKVEKNEVRLTLTEPEGYSVGSGVDAIQYSLYGFSSVRTDEATLSPEKMPRIIHYIFRVTDQSDQNTTTELILVDGTKREHHWGVYKFDDRVYKSE